MANISRPSYNEFNKIIAENKLVLTDFWANWCTPCKMVSPIIEKIANEYEGRLIVTKIDIDDNHKLSQEFGIQSIPTVILFKDGKPVSRKTGVMAFKDYANEIDRYV